MTIATAQDSNGSYKYPGLADRIPPIVGDPGKPSIYYDAPLAHVLEVLSRNDNNPDAAERAIQAENQVLAAQLDQGSGMKWSLAPNGALKTPADLAALENVGNILYVSQLDNFPPTSLDPVTVQIFPKQPSPHGELTDIDEIAYDAFKGMGNLGFNVGTNDPDIHTDISRLLPSDTGNPLGAENLARVRKEAEVLRLVTVGDITDAVKVEAAPIATPKSAGMTAGPDTPGRK